MATAGTAGASGEAGGAPDAAADAPDKDAGSDAAEAGDVSAPDAAADSTVHPDSASQPDVVCNPVAPPDAPEAFTLASVGKPTGIALTATDVYFASEDTRKIFKCPKTGCGSSAPEFVVSVPEVLEVGIAISGSSLYWRSHETQPAFKKCTLPACTTQEVFVRGRGYAGGSVGIAADSQHVYLTESEGLVSYPANGPQDGGGATLLSPSPILLRSIALGPPMLYVGGNIAGINACPLASCRVDAGPVEIVPDAIYPIAVAVDRTRIYWSDTPPYISSAPASIRSCALPGCHMAQSKLLALGDFAVFALAVDDTSLYYTDYRGGRVLRIPKD